MLNVQPEVDRYLTLLRNKIREQGFTQLQVQENVGWGRSYISQLLTRQKTLRMEQVLLILSVIGVEAQEFFSELYGRRLGHRLPSSRGAEEMGRLHEEARELWTLVHGLTDLLLGEKLITSEDLSAAVEAVEAEASSGGEEAGSL